MFKLIHFSLIFILFPNLSYAYLGPGMGGGFIAATIGIIVAIFAMLFGILWFPIKRILSKKKQKSKNDLENKE
ncbi:hypothetical protein OAR46_01460 [Candidatus Pelagibacter sp.]|jgi:biopolymer transport protein ExbB/TolQ|nr:hypothetical protein [Candidatus Pelagibacter sp.]